MKTYQVEVTDTWTVTVEASSPTAAEKKVLKMADGGYSIADFCNGATVENVEEE